MIRGIIAAVTCVVAPVLLVTAGVLMWANRTVLDSGRVAHEVDVALADPEVSRALIEALDDGRVARATLDVTDPEPLPSGHPLYAHPRVRLSPHVSWSAPGALGRLLDRFIDNLRAYVAGQPLTGVVDRVAGY